MLLKQLVEKITRIIGEHQKNFIASAHNIESQTTFNELTALVANFQSQNQEKRVTREDIKKIDDYLQQRFVTHYIKDTVVRSAHGEECCTAIVALINSEFSSSEFQLPTHRRLALKDVWRSLLSILDEDFPKNTLDPTVLLEQWVAIDELKKLIHQLEETHKEGTRVKADRVAPLIEFFAQRAEKLLGTPADPSKQLELPVNKACTQLRRFEPFELKRAVDMSPNQQAIHTEALRSTMLNALAQPHFKERTKQYYSINQFLTQLQLALNAQQREPHLGNNPFEILESIYTLEAIQSEVTQCLKTKKIISQAKELSLDYDDVDGLIQLLRDRWVRLFPSQGKRTGCNPADKVCAEVAYFLAFGLSLNSGGVYNPSTFLEPDIKPIKVAGIKEENGITAYVKSFAKDRVSLDVQLSKLPNSLWVTYLQSFTKEELAQVLKNQSILTPDNVPFSYKESSDVNRRMLVAALLLYAKTRGEKNSTYNGIFSAAASFVVTVYSEAQKTQAAMCLINELVQGVHLERIAKNLLTPGTILSTHFGALSEPNSELSKVFSGFVVACQSGGIDFNEMKKEMQTVTAHQPN